MTELERIVNETERAVLIQGKDIQRLLEQLQGIMERLERGNKQFDSLAMAMRIQELANATTSSEFTNVKALIAVVASDLKTAMQQVNVVLNDRVMLDLGNLAKQVASYNEDGSEYGKATRAEVSKISIALFDDEGKINKRLKVMEQWQHDLVIRFTFAIAVGAPIWGIVIYLVTRWVAQTFGF